MKTLFEHIEYAKGKPHHIRKRIAFTAAAAGTAIVAFVWFFGTLSSGVFALQGNSFAGNSEENGSPSTTGSDSNSAGIAGAAAALPADTSGPARIEIIDSPSSSTVHSGKQTDEKIIPF